MAQALAQPDGLREAGLVTDVEGVVEVLENLLTGRTGGRAFARCQRELHGDQIAADLLFQLVPTGGAGPRGISGADTTKRGFR